MLGWRAVSCLGDVVVAAAGGSRYSYCRTIYDRGALDAAVRESAAARPPGVATAADRPGIISTRTHRRWLGSRVVSVLDSGAEGPGFKSQSRRCRVIVLGKLFTPIVPLFTKQRNW